VKNISYISIIILLLFIIQNIALGQSSYGSSFGIVIGDDGDLTSKTENDTYTYRNGYQFGVLGTFGTYNFFISPGLYYKNITIVNKFDKIDPFVSSPKIKIAKAKVVMGYQANILTKRIKLKLGGGLNGNYLLSIDDNSEDYTFNNMEDNYLGYSIDLGLDIFFININLSYEKSLKDVYTKTDNSHKMDYLILSAGVLF